MVEVVEAMMASGPASLEMRANTSRLRSSTSGTPSKITAASRSASCASASRNTDTRAAIAIDRGRREQAEAGQRGQRGAHLAEGLCRGLCA